MLLSRHIEILSGLPYEGFSLGLGSRPGPSHSIDVCACGCVGVCVCVCVHVSVSPPPQKKLGLLGTCYIPWTFRYRLDTLELSVPFGYHGPLGTFLYLGPLSNFYIIRTFKYLLDTLDI